MADECYMLMYKWGKKSLKTKMLKSTPPALFAALMAASSDIIFGDCFEMLPFVIPPKGWIRVDSFSHSMSALSEPKTKQQRIQAYQQAAASKEIQRQRVWGRRLTHTSGIKTRFKTTHRSIRSIAPSGQGQYQQADVNEYNKADLGTNYNPGYGKQYDTTQTSGWGATIGDKINKQLGRAGNWWSNLNVKDSLSRSLLWRGDPDTVADQGAKKWYQLGGEKLPDHGNFSITKGVDRATPQIAYCCAAAMKIRWAWIFLRKKTGPGLPQLRIPHFMIRLEECIVKNHDLTDASETFQLSYNKISWFYVDSFSNTGVPSGWFNYQWDNNAKKGNHDV